MAVIGTSFTTESHEYGKHLAILGTMCLSTCFFPSFLILNKAIRREFKNKFPEKLHPFKISQILYPHIEQAGQHLADGFIINKFHLHCKLKLSYKNIHYAFPI